MTKLYHHTAFGTVVANTNTNEKETILRKFVSNDFIEKTHIKFGKGPPLWRARNTGK